MKHEHYPVEVSPSWGLSYTYCRDCGEILDGTPPPPGYGPELKYDDKLSREIWITPAAQAASDRMFDKD
jgi:hypothetical protein